MIKLNLTRDQQKKKGLIYIERGRRTRQEQKEGEDRREWSRRGRLWGTWWIRWKPSSSTFSLSGFSLEPAMRWKKTMMTQNGDVLQRFSALSDITSYDSSCLCWVQVPNLLLHFTLFTIWLSNKCCIHAHILRVNARPSDRRVPFTVICQCMHTPWKPVGFFLYNGDGFSPSAGRYIILPPLYKKHKNDYFWK